MVRLKITKDCVESSNFRERKISPKFFRPKFFHGRPRGMSVPKCLFSQDLEGLTEVFGRMSAGISGQKLPLWAEFSFLKLVVVLFFSLLKFSVLSKSQEDDRAHRALGIFPPPPKSMTSPPPPAHTLLPPGPYAPPSSENPLPSILLMLNQPPCSRLPRLPPPCPFPNYRNCFNNPTPQ